MFHYNASLRSFLTCLQNPNRDSALCAVTAVLLSIYETVGECAVPRLNHVAGARALIRECQWDSRSPGLGGICFWFNFSMELFYCLRHVWRMAWEPDNWDPEFDLAFTTGLRGVAGDEELWTRRMVYICAKVSDFRASAPQWKALDPSTQRDRLPQRCEEWAVLKHWVEEWARHAPRSMHPAGYLQPWQTNSQSSFAEVWYVGLFMLEMY